MAGMIAASHWNLPYWLICVLCVTNLLRQCHICVDKKCPDGCCPKGRTREVEFPGVGEHVRLERQCSSWRFPGREQRPPFQFYCDCFNSVSTLLFLSLPSSLATGLKE
jgi:hypothetical protein